jgi:hypothetical protein
MQISKWGCHAEFEVFPLWIMASATWQLRHLPSRARRSWLHRAKLSHAYHHRAGSSADFGVSEGAWSAVLRSTGGRDSSGTLPEVTSKR